MVTTGYRENLKWFILPSLSDSITWSLSDWINNARFSSGAVCCFLLVLCVFSMTKRGKENKLRYIFLKVKRHL